MSYQQVPIAQLQPGSYVVQVVQQSGDVVVKHAGWVRTAHAIQRLQQKGVQVVLIDPDKTLHTDTPKGVQTDVAPAVESTPGKILFDDEWPRAEKAFNLTNKVQRQVLDSARLGGTVDLSMVHEVSAGLSDSVTRNQDVLLCLARIAEQSDSLLQHSVNSAIFMAAFARHLNLPAHRIQLLITAALLHDIGKAVNPTLLQADDHLAISTSLQTLLRIRQLSGQVSLWISQHCAHLDGSGSPHISAHQIEKGSRMLAIVNNYEKLTSPLNGKLGPLAASRQLLERTPLQLDAELLQLFIKCVGVYPPGSVVKLSSGKLALVLENNAKKPTLPKVKLFYHSLHHHHIPPRILDLSRQQEEQIDACVDLKKFGLDVRNYL